MRDFAVAIIGDGFTGAVLAAQLLPQGQRPIPIALIESRPSAGGGVQSVQMLV